MLSFVSCIKYTVLYYLEPGATHLRSRSRVDSAARHRCGIREPRDLDREEAVAQAVRGYTQTLAVRRRGRGRGERGPKEGSFDRTSLRHRTCRFLIAPCHHSQMQAATRLRRWHLRSLRGTRRPHPRRRDASPKPLFKFDLGFNLQKKNFQLFKTAGSVHYGWLCHMIPFVNFENLNFDSAR